jgi:hypothetical protein
VRAKQSLDDIRSGTVGVDEARRQVLANRIAAAKEFMLAICTKTVTLRSGDMIWRYEDSRVER